MSTLALVVLVVCLCAFSNIVMTDWIEYIHTWVILAYISYMFETHQTDPKPAQILSTHPSLYLPTQSNSKPPQSGNTGLSLNGFSSVTFYSTKSLSIKRRCSLSTDPPIIMLKPGVQASPFLHSAPEMPSVRGWDIIAAFIQ